MAGRETKRHTKVHRFPVFIVNAYGGGVRAAYWTASLLSFVQDKNHTFADHVFAISGVSGGSLGAAVFTAMAKDARENNILPCFALFENKRTPMDERTWQTCASQVLHRDFLASALSAMLVPDLVRNFIPLPGPPDRAIALEQAFEAAWYWASDTTAFSNDMQDLWQSGLALHVPNFFSELQ